MLLGFSPKDKHIPVKFDKHKFRGVEHGIAATYSNYIIKLYQPTLSLYIYICNMYLFPKLMINKPLKWSPIGPIAQHCVARPQQVVATALASNRSLKRLKLDEVGLDNESFNALAGRAVEILGRFRPMFWFDLG